MEEKSKLALYHEGLSQWVEDCQVAIRRIEGLSRVSYGRLSKEIYRCTNVSISGETLRAWKSGELNGRADREKEEAIERYSAAIGLPRPEWLPSPAENQS